MNTHLLNADASGVSGSSAFHGCMPVTTSEAAVYRIDAITSVEMTPNGMSFCGLGSSSASVVTQSKPIKEKKTCREEGGTHTHNTRRRE